ncbi:MAG: hypothetical protein IKN37_05440, partial [Bacteroidales bacterium]|nr:hypothetical protein [Bacteroidales bacterium]
VFIFHLLANECKIPQLLVATIYATLQLVINVGYLMFPFNKYIYMAAWIVVLVAVHIVIYRYCDKHYTLIK